MKRDEEGRMQEVAFSFNKIIMIEKSVISHQ